MGTSWKRLRLRLRYLVRHSERQRLLWEEMDFHIESMAQDLVENGMSEAGSACGGAQKVWQYDTKIGRSSLHLDRAMDRRCGAGSEVMRFAGCGAMPASPPS